MKLVKYLLVIFVFVLFALPVFAQEATPEVTPEAMAVEGIVIQRDFFTPEGIEYNPVSEQFLVGSIAEGDVYSVADDGTVTPFVQDDDLLASIGIRVDAEHNRLLVTNTDPTPFFDPTALGNIALGIYDLTTGERLYMADLQSVAPEGRHVVNDVAVDADGNAYVTDSFSPVIYKVDMEGNPSIFIEDPALGNEFFGLNGIAYHPDGYLIVALTGAGALLKVPLDDPKNVTPVELEQPIGGDGMIFDGEGNLLVVGGGAAQVVVKLTSEDDWASATVAGSFTTSQLVTTVTVRDEAAYVLYTSFDPNPPPNSYQIVEVTFDQ